VNDAAYLLVLCALTSAAAVFVGRRQGRAVRDLGPALGRALECVGLTVVLLGVNILLGAGIVLLLRAATGRFISLYANTDATLLVLSLVQALVLQNWWRRGP
jgi:uncharacterized protein YbjT (DUF2867 family)